MIDIQPDFREKAIQYLTGNQPELRELVTKLIDGLLAQANTATVTDYGTLANALVEHVTTPLSKEEFGSDRDATLFFSWIQERMSLANEPVYVAILNSLGANWDSRIEFGRHVAAHILAWMAVKPDKW